MQFRRGNEAEHFILTLRIHGNQGKVLGMRMLLMTGVFVIAGLSSGCLVRETVTEDGEVISNRYKIEEPLHSRTDPVR